MRRLSLSWLRILTGVFVNFASAWFGLIIITPNFLPLQEITHGGALIVDLIGGIVSIVIAVKLDERINYGRKRIS